MEVKSQTLRRDSSFSFTFKTEQENGLLALSSFLGKSSGDLADFYSSGFGPIHDGIFSGIIQFVFVDSGNSQQPFNDLVIGRLCYKKLKRLSTLFKTWTE